MLEKTQDDACSKRRRPVAYQWPCATAAATCGDYANASLSPAPLAARWARIILALALLGAHLATAAHAATFRWSAGSYRIYVTGPGTVTLSDIKAGMPNALLTQVTPGVWHLRANLVMENGARLALHGTKIGGDVNELRLQSNNDGAPNAYIYVSADWGTLDIRSTKITSWDDAAQGPDTESGALRRACARASLSRAAPRGFPRACAARAREPVIVRVVLRRRTIRGRARLDRPPATRIR